MKSSGSIQRFHIKMRVSGVKEAALRYITVRITEGFTLLRSAWLPVKGYWTIFNSSYEPNKRPHTVCNHSVADHSDEKINTQMSFPINTKSREIKSHLKSYWAANLPRRIYHVFAISSEGLVSRVLKFQWGEVNLCECLWNFDTKIHTAGQ